MGQCQQKGNFNLVTTISLTIRHCGVAYNTPYFPSNSLQNCCFQFLMGMAVILRQTENYDYWEYSAGKEFTTGSNFPRKTERLGNFYGAVQ